MELAFLIISLAVISEVVRVKISQRAANLFTAIVWIALSFFMAISFNGALKEGTLDPMQYKKVYIAVYIIGLVGCGYLLPVMLGHGKRKKPLEKKEDDS